MIKRSDWVRCAGYAPVGTVKRVARDGRWADVLWREGFVEWTKRQDTRHLEIVTTLPLPGGMTVTDVTRERELTARRADA